VLKTVTNCRICNHPLKDVLDLGDAHMSSYINDTAPLVSRKTPLSLKRCDTSNQNACGFVQLGHTVPGYILYNNYFYKTGINESMVKHVKELADKGISYSKASSSDLIVDIGCNDGTLLKHYVDSGFKKVMGFDPAKNISKSSKETGAIVIEDYFHYNAVLKKTKAKLITSIAMFYDLDDPHTFVDHIKKSLCPTGGIWVTEQSYLPSMLEANSFDTICHEHLGYYTFFVLEKLLEYHELEVIDVFLNDVNGGSFQVYIAHKGNIEISEEANKRMHELRVNEFNMKFDTDEPYNDFAGRIEANKKKVMDFLWTEKNAGKKIFAYGASTKGAITLQYYGIDSNLIEACADRNEDKWGLKIIGSEIPIISEQEARKQNPDYFFVLPWHFIDGFIEREKEFLARGGQFIVPMPELKILK